LSVRVAIHSGVVVVGSGSRQEPLATGMALNVAARLQDLAAPNQVVVSAATRRLIGDVFDCHELGMHVVKGVSAPIVLYAVRGESKAWHAGEPRAAATPLVGRDRALAMLLERWKQARNGSGQVVLLGGEAGVGKSRLFRAFSDAVKDDRHSRWECRCSPYHQHSALHPFVDLFLREFGVA